MLPKQIDALIGVCPVEPLEDNRRTRGRFYGRGLFIEIDMSQPPSWQATTLVHEMAHLACCLAGGWDGDHDERGEPYAEAIGRLLPKVLLDNPSLLDADTDISEVDILGEKWRVERRDVVSEEDDSLAVWMGDKAHTIRIRADHAPPVARLFLFQMVCLNVLQAAGIEDAHDNYYWHNNAMLYALLRANPQAHPLAVMADATED